MLSYSAVGGLPTDAVTLRLYIRRQTRRSGIYLHAPRCIQKTILCSSSFQHTNMANRNAAKPSKYVCPDCGRAYKAAETMNRHRKNHQDTAEHTCSICNASFKRKDLFDRHYQIHVNGKAVTNRNRSQRACDRCSRLKTRCDNLTPCSRCARGGHECTYKHVRSRARTEKASMSTTSSVYSSPQITASEHKPSTSTSTSTSSVTAMATAHVEACSTPELSTDVESTSTWAGSPDSWHDNTWSHDPSWQWPEIDPSLLPAESIPIDFQPMLPMSYDPYGSNTLPESMISVPNYQRPFVPCSSNIAYNQYPRASWS